MTSWKLIACALVAIGIVSAPLSATAATRLTDREVRDLFDRIEHNRSEFEAALDDDLKNSIIKTMPGQVNTNEFFDDFEDQVERTRERFESDYSSSSEVLALLQYASRLAAWASAQPAGFRGSQEWGVLATDLRRLAAAYNVSLPLPAGATARRLNDEELEEAAANLEKLIAEFRAAYGSAAVGTSGIPPEKRESMMQQVDTLTSHAKALNAALANEQKGEAEADALIKHAGLIIQAVSNASLKQATAAWGSLRNELAKVAWGYEVRTFGL